MLKFCKHCNADTERKGKAQRCKPCSSRYATAMSQSQRDRSNARALAWRKANPDRDKANHVRWYEANKNKIQQEGLIRRKKNVDKKREIDAAIYKANAHKKKAQVAEYRNKNKEKIKERGLAYRRVNAEKIRLKQLAWDQANPEKARESRIRRAHNRKAKKLAVGGKLSKGLAERLMAAQQNQCVYCKQELTMKTKQIDHIMPLCLGGANEDSNIQLLCKSCNLSKGGKHPDVFAKHIAANSVSDNYEYDLTWTKRTQ